MDEETRAALERAAEQDERPASVFALRVLRDYLRKGGFLRNGKAKK